MVAGDAHLYGIRKSKQTPKELSSSTSLAFTSTLSSLLATSSSSKTTSGRPRPSKSKTDLLFNTHNKGSSKKRAARDFAEDDEDQRKQTLGSIDDDVLHRSKRKLEAKAKIYSRLKRGDLAEEGERGDESLVDFDRKWAESGAQNQEEEEEESSSDIEQARNEIVEYEDEYGRLRRGTVSEAQRMERRKRNKVLGAEELDRMSARPAMPASGLIYGDTVQTLAFNPDTEVLVKMEEIARKRDRSLTPPEMKHYEADKEIRSKGVGFYSFSKDEKLRMEEMEALERERLETERVRREREEKKEKRKLEIEERRRAIGEKRARKQADSFLDGLGASIASTEKDEAG